MGGSLSSWCVVLLLSAGCGGAAAGAVAGTGGPRATGAPGGAATVETNASATSAPPSDAAPRGTMASGERLRCEGSVTLAFAWPERLQATLTQASWMRDTGVNYPSPTLILGMQVSPDGGLHRMHFDTLRGGASSAHGLLPAMGGTFVDVLVRPDGSVDRVEGASALRRIAVRLGHEQGVSEQQLQLVGEALGDDWMLAHQRDFWELFGKTWSGRTLRCGTPVRFHRPSMELNYGHIGADVTTELEWLGDQPCAARPGGPAAGTCAHLRATQTAMLPRAVADASGAPHRMDILRRSELIVEPETLVPRAIAFAEETRLDGSSDTYTELVEEYVFEYVAPSATPPTPRRDAILAMRQPDGHLFFWPADANGQPVRLPDTPECAQLLGCCEALAASSDAHGMLCATMVMSMPDADCDHARGLAAAVVALNAGALPDVCRTRPAPTPTPTRPTAPST